MTLHIASVGDTFLSEDRYKDALDAYVEEDNKAGLITLGDTLVKRCGFLGAVAHHYGAPFYMEVISGLMLIFWCAPRAAWDMLFTRGRLIRLAQAAYKAALEIK